MSDKQTTTTSSSGNPTGQLDYKEWSIDQVSEWVNGIKYGTVIAPILKQQLIDGDTLDTLTDSDIKSILPLGAAKSLLAAIKQLNPVATPSTGSNTDHSIHVHPIGTTGHIIIKYKGAEHFVKIEGSLEETILKAVKSMNVLQLGPLDLNNIYGKCFTFVDENGQPLSSKIDIEPQKHVLCSQSSQSQNGLRHRKTNIH